MQTKHGNEDEMYNDLFSIGKITVHGYGLMIGIGFAAAVLLATYRAKKKGLSPDDVLNIAIFAPIIGFLGAKVLYIIVEWEQFIKTPLKLLGSGGFVVYGGILAGAGVGVFYCLKKKLDFWEYFDLIMPEIAIAQGFGRIGCFLAGCCYGAQTSSWLGVIFPEGSLAPAGVKLLPTQLFSSAGNFVIAAVLLLMSKKRKNKGDIGAFYLLFYGIGRYVVEIFRNDARGNIGVLSTSQFISIFIVIGAIALLVWNRKRNKKKDMK